ncbi:MFS general substrate transporter [Microthyrium microscopicum]|uniref:MFS general substrate transporter n=1 Tax=Microthyrium microscopicum TaxID=703497 RepID=A0A6A6US62_9PEZI|nr:MFS general substrate transporter [Microthyrium microscopicum]
MQYHDQESTTSNQDLEKASAPDGSHSDIVEPTTKSEIPRGVNPWDPSQFPDGGLKAWLVVAGSFSCLFCSFGWINCIGIFQDYYQTHQLKEFSPSTISWIGSLEVALMLFGGLFVGRIYDNFGPRPLLIFGTFFHVFGLMMTSISTEYYQILLAQGICSPIGIACLFTPATNSVVTWFMKRRAFAIGIVASGSSLGGVIFPIMFNKLIAEVGFGWAMRISAFLILAMLIFAILTVEPRMSPLPTPFKVSQYTQALKEWPFVLTTISAFLFYLGLFIPINYIQTQAIEFGMEASLAAYLIPILNAASIFGRVCPGYAADKIGKYNVNIITCFLSGIMCLALWLPGNSNAAIIVFAALYGFSSGAFVSLLFALIAQISDMREIGMRSGFMCAILAIPSLVSNPIGGALITHDHGQFRDVQIWAGVIMLAGACMFVVTRTAMVGFRFVKV